MALAIQKSRTPSAKGRLLSTLVMAFALMLQPMYGLVAGQVANASTPDTIIVDENGGGDYTTITEALNAADEGDIISVAPGTYAENLEITKKVKLEGSGAKRTIIVNDPAKSTYLIRLNGSAQSGTKISGFTLQNTAVDEPVLKLGTGANLNSLYITGNHFKSNNKHLIYAGNVSNSNFTSNTFYVDGINNEGGNRAAVFFEGTSSGNTFKNNRFTGNTESMVLGINGVNNTFLTNNLSSLTTTYHKVFEVKGSSNIDEGSSAYGTNQVVINPGSNNFRGVYGTIPDAINEAQSGDTLVAMAGSYDLPQTVINKNLTLIGQGVGVTTILQSSGTIGSAGWMQVSNGVNFTVKDLTLDGNSLNGNQTYHAINYTGAGDGSVENVRFQNIRHGVYQGTGVYVNGSRKVNVSGSQFGNMGRNGALYNGNVEGDFKNNTYTGKGEGTHLDYALTLWFGANVNATGNTITDNVGVADDTQRSRSAGFNVWDHSSLSLESNKIKDNTIGVAVVDDGTVNMSGNSVTGNDWGVIAYTIDSSIDAKNNWWGHVTGPSGIGKGAGDRISAPTGHSVVYSPWLCAADGSRLSDEKPNCYTPNVTSVTPGNQSVISGSQKIYVNISNPEVMRGGWLQLNKAVESGNPLNSNKSNYKLQQDENGWFAVVDTTVLDDTTYLFKVEAHGVQTPWGYYGNNSAWQYPSYYFVVDNQAPEATLEASNYSPTTDSTVTITGSVSDDDIKSHWFEITTPGGTYHEYNMNTTDKSYSFELDTSAGVGEYRIRYVATDRVGNRSDSIAPAVLVLNVVAPQVDDDEEEDVPSINVPTDTTGGEEDDDEDRETTQGPSVFPSPIFAFGNQDVLGEQDETETSPVADSESEGVVAGDQDESGTPLSDTAAFGMDAPKLLGLVWYWWVAILAAIVGGWLLIAAAIRRGREEEA